MLPLRVGRSAATPAKGYSIILGAGFPPQSTFQKDPLIPLYTHSKTSPSLNTQQQEPTSHSHHPAPQSKNFHNKTFPSPAPQPISFMIRHPHHLDAVNQRNENNEQLIHVHN